MSTDTMSADSMFETVLVANRGEIACRVIRTLATLGIRSVAVYSDADRDAPHVRLADVAVRIGPAEARRSYLDADAIIEAARRTGAQAIHPGYGFLSENVAFARACIAAGLVFIGPDPVALEVMGDKIRSKNHVVQHGVAVTPGIAQPGLDDEALVAAADDIGFPILIKPSAGGGGKGMYAVSDAAELPDALRAARRVASAAFGDDTLFLERLIASPRHIEVQILADTHGNTIHLGERECSLQRRHQKVIEEAPSPLLRAGARAKIGEAACAVARSVNYVGAGTVEFLVSAAAPDEFFFMEMNTRLQVEHPVTEEVTGIDLVEWQVRIASGQPLTIAQAEVTFTGHAIEARVYAENPQHEFLPSIGRILALHEPAGAGIRVDSGIAAGLEISPHYDPMLAKVIASGHDRQSAIERLERALGDTVILGVHTNIEYLSALLAEPAVRAGELDTGLIEATLPGIRFHGVDDDTLIAAALTLHAEAWQRGTDAPWSRPTGWRVGGSKPVRYRFDYDAGDSGDGSDGARTEVRIVGAPNAARVSIVSHDGERQYAASIYRDGTNSSTIRLVVDRVGRNFSVAHSSVVHDSASVWISQGSATFELRILERARVVAEQVAARAREDGSLSPELRSPMPGTVVAVDVSDGEQVEAGANLLTIEAMKMEHRLRSPVAGIVTISLHQGDVVKAGQLVASVTPHEG